MVGLIGRPRDHAAGAAKYRDTNLKFHGVKPGRNLFVGRVSNSIQSGANEKKAISMHITLTLSVEWTAANVRVDSCERVWLNEKRCSVVAGSRRQERSKIPWVTVSMISLLDFAS